MHGSPPDLTLVTARLLLEPVGIDHARELFELFADPELHRFTDSQPPTLDEMRARCERWATGRSPDGRERWLNWAARDRETRVVVGHFQAGIVDRVATLGYTVARAYQRRGLAGEALRAVIAQLDVDVCEVSIDPGNLASIALARRLGLSFPPPPTTSR